MRYRFVNKQGYFCPETTKYPYCYVGGKDAEAIVEAGYRLSRRQTDHPDVYPDGYYLIYRRCDGKLIGRAEKETTEDLKGWKGRYYFFGGGSTFGTFRTLRGASLHVLKKNSSLGEGWDN